MLPETLTVGIVVIGILLANSSIIGVSIVLIFTQLITNGIGRILLNLQPGMAVASSSMSPCTMSLFETPLISSMVVGEDGKHYWHSAAPSIYLSTIGFFTGWGVALQQIYKQEIDRGVLPKGGLIAAMSLSVIILLLAITFRISSGCESLIGAISGSALGILFGFVGCVALSEISNRKATNIWGIPLLRKK